MKNTENMPDKRQDFFSAEEFSTIKASFSELSGTSEYLALERYYSLANESVFSPEKLPPVKLFQEVFESLLRQKSTRPSPALRQAHTGLKQYASRLSNTVGMLSKAAAPVPKIMHFVWVGGSEVGAIQRDYMNIWRKVLAPEGYTFNLWYDSDALLAFEMNRVILDSARVHAMESGGDQVKDSLKLSMMIEDRARVLKLQMAEFLAQPQWAGKADKARMDLMVRAYGKDRSVLEAFRQKCLDTHLEVVGQDLRLRDVRHEFADHYLKDVYQREVAMRGNFAAASDVVRLQAEYLEGGRYSDMDYLPPLAETLGGVDIRRFSGPARLGVLQLLLNHNDVLMPGRDLQRYPDRTNEIPVGDKEALLKFARSNPDLLEVFVSPRDGLAPQEGFRMAIQGDREMNSHFLAHPHSGMTESVMQMIRFNYDCLYEVEGRLFHDRKQWGDSNALLEAIKTILTEKKDSGAALTQSYRDILSNLGQSIFEYYQDGIRIGARGTITLTGPGAAISGLNEYIETHLAEDDKNYVHGQLKLAEGYNVDTEEERISGWTVNAQPEAWLKNEQEKWKAGKLKSRYVGDMTELLKEQSLTFKQGWPIIEGKPVLQASILQQLLNELGEPFIRAMNDKLSGDISLGKNIAISFEQRQGLQTQPAREIPSSIGAEPFGNLNEMLTRIAGNKLSVEQLSPLHRVLLGGLFGATTLDNEGFASAWEATRTLAVNSQDRGLAARYDLIEQVLRKHNPQAFERSLNTQTPPTEGAQSSRVLKAKAFAEPLSVLQWGESIGRIQIVAKEEYLASILQKGHRVREQLYQAGAIAAKQLPQGLLVRGNGDPGRRCYPLALVMGAALEKGHAAERALIGKLANANVPVADAETHAFLRALDELRSIPMAQFGDKLGSAKLATVMQTLEAKTTSSILMLNTDNHSMLAAKVVEQGETSWRFYDPNFGLYTFERGQDLQKGIEDFLADRTIAGLYGLAKGSDPTFNLVELDGSKIAGEVLPSQLMVGALLRSEAIAGGRTIEAWQHHAALRARSLSENARLGQGLAILDTNAWAGQIERATRRLQSRHQLSRDFVPVFESLRPVSVGLSEITLINAGDPRLTRQVVTDDEQLPRIKSYLTELYETISVKAPVVVDPTDVSSVHTLNVGFALQALLMELKNRESTDNSDGSTPLTDAVRVHGYLAYAQLTHGVVVDVVEIINLVRHAFTDSLLVARTTSSVVVNALGHVANEGVGTVLQLAAVGFDIYLLANAENEAQRAQFATQLAFDSAGLALAVGGVGAGLVGAGTAAAFLGGGSVIFGGLAIGIGALVEGFGGILEQARQVGKYINRVEEAYRTGGYSVVDDAFCANPYAVITRLDLLDRSIDFGSQVIFSASTSTLHPPQVNPDRSQGFSVREALKYPDRRSITQVTEFETVVLPCSPHCYLGFEYKALPFATTRYEHFETALKLENDDEGNRRFWFSFYKFPSEYILNVLYPNYEATTITVVLSRSNKFLQVPSLPGEMHGYLSYEITGVGGQCTVGLAKGVKSLKLMQSLDGASMSWALGASWLAVKDVTFAHDGLQLGTLQVHAPGKPDVYLQFDKQSYQVDWEQKTLLLSELQIDTGATESAIKATVQSSHLAGRFTAVRNFPVPYEDPLKPVYTTAHYDRIEDRFMFVRGLDPAYEKEARLGAIIGNDAYYYVPDEVLVWRADIVTGQVNRIYRLMDPLPGSRITAFQDLGAGLMRIVQKISDRNGHSMKLIYLLGADELSLMTVIGELTDTQKLLLQGKTTLSMANVFWGYEVVVRPSKLAAFDAVNLVDYTFAPLTAINVLQEGARTSDNVWVRRDDGLVIRPRLPLMEGQTEEPNVILLKTHEADGDMFLFYDQQHHSLYRQRVTVQGEEPATDAVKILPHNVTEVVFQARQLIAQTRDGLLFRLDRIADSTLVGLNEAWLSQAVKAEGAGLQWWKSALAVADRLATDKFEVSGVQNFPVNARLNVWCVDKRVLIADPIVGQHLRLLALTPDKKAAWLWDESSGRIYRQRFMAVEDLPAAFGNGTRLLRRDLIPALQRESPEWSFSQVSPHEAGLRGLTYERVWIKLSDNVPARIIGVESDFFHGVGNRSGREEKLRQLVAGRHSTDVLTAGRFDDVFNWYDVTARRLFSTTVPSNGRWPVYLGARDGETALLYNPLNRQLFSNRGSWVVADHDVWAQADTTRRNGEVLTVHCRNNIDSLSALIPEGVTTLVLGLNEKSNSCSVSQEAWSRLDCLIVDFAGLKPTWRLLKMTLQEMDQWLVTMIDGHLMLTDPEDGRSLVLRNAKSASTESRTKLELVVGVSGTVLVVSAEDLVEGLGDRTSIQLLDLLVLAAAE